MNGCCRRFARGSIALVGLVAALVVVGCAVNHSSAPVFPQVTQPVGPFGGLTNISAAQQARLQIAQNILIARCMQRQSFVMNVTRPPVPIDTEATTGDYGLISPSAAAAEGYGIADNAQTNQIDNQVGGSAQSDSSRPGFRDALSGTPAHQVTLTLIGGATVTYDADGCVTIAINELYGPQWNQVYFDINGLASRIEQSMEDSANWRSAVSAWSRCMRGRYQVSFASPQDARSEVTTTASGAVNGVNAAIAKSRLAAVRAGEVRLASEDATCQQQVHLAAIAQAAQNQAQQADALRYRQEIHTYAAELAAADRMTATLVKQ